MTSVSARRELIDTVKGRFWERIAQRGPHECWEWTGYRFRDGYGGLSVNGKKRKAHRLMYEILIGPIPEGLCVCHTCDNPPCVNPEHLYAGTVQQNVADREARHRRNPPTGAAHWNSKLTDEQYAAVRVAVASGESQRVVARRYGVSQHAVWRMVHRP